ncbi:MAG: hypothetical protein LBQ30_04310, partial [Treponema sp.]|nr:hypothetical protein [Treponema sp.]
MKKIEKHRSSHELDAYGIWVKNDPQTLSVGETPEKEEQDERSIPDSSGGLVAHLPDPPGEQAESIPSVPKQDCIPIKGSQKSAAMTALSITDGLFDDIVIEDFLDPSAPADDAALVTEEPQPSTAPDTPAKPLQSLGALLRNILEELILIRQEVATLKDAVIQGEKSAEVAFESPLAPDEKITITGDELTDIFNHAVSISKEVSPAYTDAAACTEKIEAAAADEEPDSAYEEWLALQDSLQESEPFQDAGLKPEPEAALSADASGGTVDKLLFDHSFDQTFFDEIPLQEPFDEALLESMLKDAEAPNEQVSHEAIVPETLPEARSPEAFSHEDFLLEDLLIENGSMKDMPIELNPEDEEEIDHTFDTIETLIGGEASAPEETAVHDKTEDEDPPDDSAPFDGFGPGSAADTEDAETQGAGEGDPSPTEEGADPSVGDATKPFNLKQEVKNVLLFMDQILESLPEDKIGEFAESNHFITYKNLFTEL